MVKDGAHEWSEPAQVHKLGGTSVAAAVRLIANAKTRPVVVSSVTAGTTSQLVETGGGPPSGHSRRLR